MLWNSDKFNFKKLKVMKNVRVVKRKVNKDNVKLGLILCFFSMVLVYVLMFGNMNC